MARPYKCPYCGKQENVSKGRRRTKTMGNRCIRLCKACRRKFTPRNQKVPDVVTPYDGAGSFDELKTIQATDTTVVVNSAGKEELVSERAGPHAHHRPVETTDEPRT